MDYSKYHWFDEFDPQYLHLGRAKGPFTKRGSIHWREFDDGWVVVNGEAKDATGLMVPAGSARVLHHRNFKQWQTMPLVTSFNLAAHRGIVLLREGKSASNRDNVL